ncbi:MAG TPA: SRPBCC domain-containing protein [Gaiellales bacterium]|jgi:uncharacterized protein YndB with AHSA1/START domain
MTLTRRHGSATVALPSEREVLVTRKFDAPAELLFDVLTKPEHVRVWFTDGDQDLEVCDIDLRVGGDYRYVGVFADGTRCAFHGTFIEIERPTRTVETWVFEGRPDDEAVETVELHEQGGVTTMRNVLAFKDQATRDATLWAAADGVHAADGIQGSYDNLEDYLATLT